MIGHQIYKLLDLDKNYTVYPYYHKNHFPSSAESIDVTNHREVYDIFLKIDPDYVINCSGKLIEYSERNPLEAMKINAAFPRFLQQYSRLSKCKIIQISTDCVFSGENGPYEEYAIKDGMTSYSISKGLGEIVDTKNLTIRSSVIGPDIKHSSPELFHWIMFQNQKEIYGYKNAMWSGISSLELANQVVKLLGSSITGILHVSMPSPISKYDLLKLVINIFGLNIKLHSTDKPINNKVLLQTRNDIKILLPTYKKMLIEMKDILFKSELYSHYQKRLN